MIEFLFSPFLNSYYYYFFFEKVTTVSAKLSSDVILKTLMLQF